MYDDTKRHSVEAYESCSFERLLGETLRPGGLELTARLAEVAGVGRDHVVLDLACGKGVTALFLARERGCRVIGLDLSEKMIATCRNSAQEEGLAGRVSFLLGDGENLPFDDSSFDAIVSECSFSLLPNKEPAARDMARVLKPGGKLVMTDIVLRREISGDIRSRLGVDCCMGGAMRVDECVDLLLRVGLGLPYVEDHSHELRKVAFRLGLSFGSADRFLAGPSTGSCRRKEAAGIPFSLGSFEEFLKQGRPGYALIAATKGRGRHGRGV